ncbi:MAG: PfkB family carbohydrate kinase [Chitinophagaceae bacterium]
MQKITNQQVTCVGTGLVALDIILNGHPLTPPKLHAGGSCGNVLTILSFLGWKTIPIARLSKIKATKELIKDLTTWNVETKLLSTQNDGSTPVIIHRILKDKDGNPKHRFEFNVPGTNEFLPRYKPVLGKEVENIVSKQDTTKVFYLDRLSRSSVDLAKHYNEKGALIVLEPTSIKEKRLFDECMEVVHILKFSNDRIKNYSEQYPTATVAVEIETKGKEGLCYRYKNDIAWKNIPAYKIGPVIDAAGAGDWCTSGIIHELGRSGAGGFAKKKKEDIKQALQVGQALGALNCLFDGARGAMYKLDQSTIIKLTNNILHHKELPSDISSIPAIKLLKMPFDIKTLL